MVGLVVAIAKTYKRMRVFNNERNNLQLKRFWPGLMLASLVFFASCTENEIPPTYTPSVFIDAEPIGTYNTQSIRSLTTLIGFNAIAQNVAYDVALYKINYKTQYKDEQIVASGLLGIPVDIERAYPVISIQHGTITAHRDAPTKDYNSYLPYIYAASMGYMVLVPDFIGFGSSEQVLHPYYIAQWTASGIIDMILAGKEFGLIQGLPTDDRLFLAGYSEGGYTTMATHKAIEENPASGLLVTASAPSSGGYDLGHMQEYFFAQHTYGEPYYLAYVLMAFFEEYNTDLKLSDIFREPYASRIPGLYNGDYSGSQINNQLTIYIDSLLTEDVMQNINTSAKYADLRQALLDNSLTSWIPANPMRMYHGTADITVPYSNSTSTYQKLLQAGADPDKVQFFALEGATHGTGVVPYVKDIIPWILSFED